MIFKILARAAMRLAGAALLVGCASTNVTAARQTGFVDAPDGGSIHYSIEGEGPPVVLLHSGFSHSGLWDETMSALQGRRVIKLDARGHGRTPLPARPALGAADVKAAMDALGIARADLIGSSMGGATAIDLALMAPDRVGKIILAGAAPMGGTGGTAADMRAMEDITVAAAESGLEAGVAKWVEHPMNAAASPAVRQRLRELALESPAIFSIRSMRNFPLTYLRPFAMNRLGELKSPVLMIVGGRDVAMIQQNARLAATSPRMRLVFFETSGHFPSLEEPERFNGLVREFLNAPSD